MSKPVEVGYLPQHNKVDQQRQFAQAQIAKVVQDDVLQAVVEKCFSKCPLTRSTQLWENDLKCLDLCFDKYITLHAAFTNMISGRITAHQQGLVTGAEENYRPWDRDEAYWKEYVHHRNMEKLYQK